MEIRADAANNRIIADLYRGIAVNKTSATQAELSQFLVELKATPYDLHTHVLLRAADHALASYSVILSSWVEAKLRLASEYARTDLRPPWSDNRGKRKQSCLEFDKMDGWTQTNVVRCLANCYKHNSGCCRKDDGRVLGMSEGEGIDYLACQDASGAWRARDWDGYTEGVTSFLNAVVAGLPSLKTASLSEA